MSLTGDILNSYKTKMNDWEKNSIVRSSPESYHIDTDYFLNSREELSWHLPTYAPILQNQQLKDLSHSQQQYILGMQLLEFTDKTTRFEIDYVNTVTADIALGRYNFDLPDFMKLDAYKVYTDEGYHAYFSEKVSLQIHTIFNEDRLYSYVDKYFAKFTNVLNSVQLEDQYLVKLGIVFISETMILKDIADQMNGVVFKPIQAMFRDHIYDESSHCIYFSTLFQLIWLQLSHREKVILGLCLHDLLLILAAPRTDLYYYSLGKLGYSPEKINSIVNESLPTANLANKIRNKAKVTINLFKKTGVFMIPEVKERFLKSGII